MTRELLVAVDGSTHSDRVVDYATQLAKELSARIALLYVNPAVPIPEDYKQYAREEKIPESDYYDRIAGQILKKYSDIVNKQGIEFETLSEVGNAAENITTVAMSRKSDVILVGLQGLHGLGRMRSLGSVSRRVIENSSVPVLVVP
jgi:nucleotide-binding universal stress UspA family protein